MDDRERAAVDEALRRTGSTWATPGPVVSVPPAANLSTPPAEAPPPVTPAPVQSPAPQSPRQAEMVAAPPAPAVSPPDAPAFDPSAPTKSLKAGIVESTNRQLDTYANAADAKGEQASKLEGIEKARAEAGADTVERKRDVADKSREAGDEYRKQMEDEIKAMKAKMGAPPFDTVGMIFGIVSAIAAANGKDKVGAAMQNIGKAVNYRMQQWQGEVAGHEAAAEGFGKLVDKNRLQGNADMANEADVAKSVAAEFLSASDAVGAQAKTQAEKDALVLVNEQLLQGALKGEVAKRKAEAIRARRAEAYRRMAAEDTTAGQQAVAAQYPDVGQDVYRDLTKSAQETAKLGNQIVETEVKAAGIDKTAADAEKARAEASKFRGESGKGRKLTESESKTDAIVAGGEEALVRLKNTFEWEGELPRGATRETFVPDFLTSTDTLQNRADVKNLTDSFMRAMSGANVPPQEAEARVKAFGLDSGDPKVRANGVRQLIGAFESLDRQGRLDAAAAGPVRLQRADGSVKEYPPETAKALLKTHPELFSPL